MTAAHPSTGWRHRAVAAHTRTEIDGLALLAGGLLIVLVAGIVTGLPLDDAAFLLVVVGVLAVGAALAWRFGTVGRGIGLALGLAGAVVTFWMGFGLLAPSSFVEFTGGTAYVLGLGLLLYGGVASLVRRDDVQSAPARSEVTLERTVIGIVVLAFVVSLSLWLVNRTTVDPAAAAGLPEVTATNFVFEDVTLPAGQEALVVRNTDPFLHTFTVDALGIDVRLLPGSATIVPIDASAGSYTYYCVPHSAEGGEAADDMAATLTIE